MMTLALGPSWLDPDYLLDTFGIWGLLLIVFAESGLLIGFFLPGDSLLFTCGLLITSGQLDFPLWAAIALICLAAILGDQAGYMFGKKVGPSLFNRPDSRLFKQENVVKAHEFFEKYGPKSLVLARFVPIVRTFTPIIAGVSGMRYRSFLTFNVIGGVLWGAGVTLLGSWLGNIGFVHKNIEAILILIVLVSVVPIAIEFLRARAKSKRRPRPEPEPAAPQQPRYQQQHQHPYGQPQYQQPVMDDATTRLRRIEPDQPYGHPQQEQQQYGQPQHGQQQYGQQQYGQQQYWDQNGGYGDQQYPQQQPYQDQQQPPYQDRQQYPYDHQQGGNHRAP
ncbi:VTT domain-containing protein [Streptomyces sp. LP11]|uniref:VTT domain-containing protein n=1 Tax=Streptomyces pyxinicus TaxID=2970331 RepID=A0ABT2AXM2_9ACTN|nr:VTT domain-containing protein [Streptomyces sp. LP11]MCS0600997.1 VTT domain-containing protein [Streptomyces sp. LP11]